MNESIRIIIADDQELFRDSLKSLLESEPDLCVVGEAANGEEAIKAAVIHQPDVVLMDLRMPVMDGVTATKRILASLSSVKIIVLTTFDDDDAVFDGLRAGAIGYLLKDITPDQLFEAIRSAKRGEYFLLPSITAKVMAEFNRLDRTHKKPEESLLAQISTREMEVLRLMAKGANNKEISEQLFISEGTVKNHITSILGKLNARDRIQAVIVAREHGLI
ncbi:MAG TPA: response regulator transcription factor [Bellilinea sp.]|nr:response regulator transcription factor [Bellilinea sp.]